MKAHRLLLLAATLLLAGCAARMQRGLPPAFALLEVPDPLRPRMERLAAEGPRNWVLNLQELATESLAHGERDIARMALDEAILQIEVIYGDSPQARRARSVFYSEESKIFKGDPYERTMTYFLRGVLYMQDRDWDNARACFRSAAFMDAFAEDEQARCDWALMDYLIGVCNVQLGNTSGAADAFAAARRNHEAFAARYAALSGPVGPRGPSRLPLDRPLPSFDEHANLLVLVQQGNAPRKVGVGRYGEFIGIAPGGGADRPALVRINHSQGKPVTFADSVFFQAATRGGRELDRILGRQAFFKGAAQDTGEAAARVGILATAIGLETRNKDITLAGLGIAAFGLAAHCVSAMVRPEADLRQWQALPDALALAVARVNESTAAITIDFPSNARARASIQPPPAGLCVILAFEKPAPMLVIAPNDLAAFANLN